MLAELNEFRYFGLVDADCLASVFRLIFVEEHHNPVCRFPIKLRMGSPIATEFKIRILVEVAFALQELPYFDQNIDHLSFGADAVRELLGQFIGEIGNHLWQSNLVRAGSL